MKKPEKDEFVLGLQKDLNDMGIKNVYKRMRFYDYKRKGEFYVHQIMVTGLICRAMYITFIADPPEIHVSDRMYYEYSTKDWHFVLTDPKSNPQLIVDLFRDLKAVGDKYGRTPPPPPPPQPKPKADPVLIEPIPYSWSPYKK